jgi:molybdopterin molybdotransferase
MPEMAERDLAQAYALLAGAIAPVVQTQRVDLALACGRVLAQALVADRNLPSEDLAAMDGYAVRSADAGAARNELVVAGRVLAGQRFEAPVGRGRCVRIMTGAPMPADCDAVVIQEVVAPGAEGTVIVPGPVAPGANRRRRGEHVAAGSTLLRPGRRLRPADLGLASAIGAADVQVFRRLRVGVLSTGDELRSPPAELSAGTSYDSNRPMMLAALAESALDCVDLGICPDDLHALLRIIERAFVDDLDAVLISGGASQGDADVVRSLPEIVFQPIHLRPGRGVAWAQWHRDQKRLLLLGLPGNAVAAFVLLHLLARPLLAHMAGAESGPPLPLRLPIASDLRTRPGQIDFRRARLVRDGQGATAIAVLPEQGSAMIRTVCEADALVAVGPQAEYHAGAHLPCYLLEGLGANWSA